MGPDSAQRWYYPHPDDLVALLRTYSPLFLEFARIYESDPGISPPPNVLGASRFLTRLFRELEAQNQHDPTMGVVELTRSDIGLIKALAIHHQLALARKIKDKAARYGNDAVQSLVEQRESFDALARHEAEATQIPWPTEHVLRQVDGDLVELVAPLLEDPRVVPKQGTIFVAMPLPEDGSTNPHYDSIVNAIQVVNEEFETSFTPERVDLRPGTFVITHEIERLIEESAAVVVDLTDERPSVYFEAGFAKALRKPTFWIARRGTHLHFDVNHYACDFFDGPDLAEKLKRRMVGEFQKRGTLPHE